MDHQREYETAGMFTVACAVLGVGLLLFAADMRTVQAPADDQLLADFGTVVLLAGAVVSGAIALFIRAHSPKTDQ